MNNGCVDIMKLLRNLLVSSHILEYTAILPLETLIFMQLINLLIKGVVVKLNHN